MVAAFWFLCRPLCFVFDLCGENGLWANIFYCPRSRVFRNDLAQKSTSCRIITCSLSMKSYKPTTSNNRICCYYFDKWMSFMRFSSLKTYLRLKTQLGK